MRRLIYLFLVLSVTLYSCKEDEEIKPNNPIQNNPIFTDTLILNPSGYAPLSALLKKQTRESTKAKITIRAKSASVQDLSYQYSNYATQHELAVLGLYPSHLNTVLVDFTDAQGNIKESLTYTIQTDSLNNQMPNIVIVQADQTQMSAGMTLVSYFGNGTPNFPIIFDEKGNIRWYLDFSTHPVLNTMRYDNGMERNSDGYFVFGDIPSNTVYEVDMLGNFKNSFGLGDHTFHHQVFQESEDRYLITTSKNSSIHSNGDPTVEDYAVLVDRSSGNIIKEWDLKNSLDENRTIWTGSVLSNPVDWFHGNGIISGGTDGSIIISGRTQGVAKLSSNNQPIWIIAPHKDWDTSRLGYNMNNYLLTPLDAAGMPITDTSVLNGHTNHPNFEWPWYQHAPKLMPNGNLILFDNGDNRNYLGGNSYSRAVEYEIDEQQMTIKQVWSYGKTRGTDCYSRIVSDVDYLADKDNILFSPGFGLSNNSLPNGGKIVEVDRSSKNVVFEAHINPVDGVFLAFTRAERLSLYPN